VKNCSWLLVHSAENDLGLCFESSLCVCYVLVLVTEVDMKSVCRTATIHSFTRYGVAPLLTAVSTGASAQGVWACG
jgi:hypothetical protein